MLLWPAASGSGQTALVQQKTMAASSGTAPAATGVFSGAGIGTGSRVIDGLWQFHLGDDPRCAQPGFDDSGWERLPADKPWAKSGHPDSTGFAWYRRQIVLDPADTLPLGLYLADESPIVEIYWNGAKIGSVGTPPPHPLRYWNQQPVAFLLPSSPGARSGTLALRVWMPTDGTDRGGFHELPTIGYAPVIQLMVESWNGHRLTGNAALYALFLIQFCVGFLALALWLRSHSQWIQLCVGIYFVTMAAGNLAEYGLFSIRATVLMIFFDIVDWINHTAFLFLILLLAGLPNRPGIRGFRFWKRICVAASAVVLLGAFLSDWQGSFWDQPPSALSRFLNTLPDIRDIAEAVSLVILLIACSVLSKPRLPRLLFMAAAGLEVFFGDLVGYATKIPGFEWLSRFSVKPLFYIYGAIVQPSIVLTLLLLAAIVYAVSDQLRRELAEQRRASAELKAAQEVHERCWLRRRSAVRPAMR